MIPSLSGFLRPVSLSTCSLGFFLSSFLPAFLCLSLLPLLLLVSVSLHKPSPSFFLSPSVWLASSIFSEFMGLGFPCLGRRRTWRPLSVLGLCSGEPRVSLASCRSLSA